MVFKAVITNILQTGNAVSDVEVFDFPQKENDEENLEQVEEIY